MCRIIRFGFCLLLAQLAFTLAGCGGSGEAGPAARLEPAAAESVSSLEELGEAIERAQKESTAPPAVIELPSPDGWRRSDPRALPQRDHGFSITFDHESGLTVTLYQYTRGLAAIADEVDAAEKQKEMNVAKRGIQQFVELGGWEAAAEKSNGVVKLGDSSQEALWSRYEIQSSGNQAVSDIYIWSRANTFLKLRCTSRAEDREAKQALHDLLTLLGEAPLAKR